MANTREDLYELQWNNHTRVLKGTFHSFRLDNELVDVTLSCEGKKLKAHKIILSACSSYFLDLFKDNPCQHPIVILRDVKYQAMSDILNFMYVGEVNVAMEHLNMFLETAEFLQVKGLSEELPHISNLVNNISNDTEENEKTVNDDKPVKPVSFANTEIIKNLSSKDICKPVEIEQEPMKTEDIDIEDLTKDDSLEYYEVQSSSQDPEMSNTLSIVEELKNQTQSKSFPCPYCDKVFSHQVSLKLHLPQHSGSTSCALCHAVLSRKYELKIHMRRRHNIDMDILYMR